MSKLTEYSAATRFDSGDILIKDGTNGTKKITAANAAVEFAGLVSSVNHRNIYRGKNLGSTITDAQKTAISSGTFDDLFIGDYWYIADSNGANRIYRIADMDYWHDTGDDTLRFQQHHLVIVPDSLGITAAMNSTSTTTGGYALSEMRTDVLSSTNSGGVYEMVHDAFGDTILTHREFLVNAVSDGSPSGIAWYDSTIELMNECMVYGSRIMSKAAATNIDRTIDKSQLSLFRLDPQRIDIRQNYWLRYIGSDTMFCSMHYTGNTAMYTANTSMQVRPVFAIG